MGAFTDLKITAQELADHGMTSLPGTRWTNQAEMLKAKLDEDGTFVGGRLGAVLDELESGSAAGNIGAAPFSGYDSTTVQGLIEETATDLQGKIDDVIAGVLPDDSITTDKIRGDAVTEDKIADGAVTSAKIANGTITDNDLSQAYKNSVANEIKATLNRLPWVRIVLYVTAGSGTWTVPDLFNGQSYYIGVLVIGAGASGGAASNMGTYVSGGPSGFTSFFTMIVSPGQQINRVVGAGGAAVSSTGGNGFVAGNNGGSSSFNGRTALGGIAATTAYRGGIGAQCSFDVGLHMSEPLMVPDVFGGCVTMIRHAANRYIAGGTPSMCVDPFENKRILGAGGCAYINDGTPASSAGGKDPIGGLGGGNGAAVTSGSVTGTAGNGPGCGGGAACCAQSAATATSGKGADGAIYIYARRAP